MSTKVRDLLVGDAILLSPEHTVGVARQRMLGHRIHALPVVNSSGEPVGMVTTHDLVEAEVPADTPVAEIMSRDVQTVTADDDAETVARLMLDNFIHHVVVVDGTKLKTILSSFDLLRLIAGESYPQ